MLVKKLSAIYLCIGLLIAIVLLLIIDWCFSAKDINTEQDDKDLAAMLERDRNRRSFESGKEAYDRLNEKYGTFDSGTLPRARHGK